VDDGFDVGRPCIDHGNPGRRACLPDGTAGCVPREARAQP
jgi:hypothetical protein